MKWRLLLVAAGVLFAASAWAQSRITSFKSTGELTWTNSAIVGAYQVEWANTPTGSWNAFAAETNLNAIWVKTNRVTVLAPVSNPTAFYRVAWLPPQPLGVWDYYGSNLQGTLVVTGQLHVTSKTLVTSEPWRQVYNLQGFWNLQYAGPPTNQYSAFGPQFGTGQLSGGLDVAYASLYLNWPTNGPIDGFHIDLSGTLWPNTFTGKWYHAGIAPIGSGPFTAQRH